MSEPRCHYCGIPVNPFAPGTLQRVEGWERKAAAESRRGGSDIILREPREEFACSRCIVRLQQGLAPAQESLL
jgi:hypothetical protein